MCLSIPGKVIDIEEDKAIVDYSGEKREANTSLVKAKIGDYVIVNAGFIMEKLSKEEAEKCLNSWKNESI